MMGAIRALAGLLPALALTLSMQAHAQQPASRGAMLYAAQCAACHTTQVHWRAQRLATDWRTLQFQVRRWQDVASLRWTEEDIVEVTRHLNDSYYQFAPPERVGTLDADGRAEAMRLNRHSGGWNASHPN